MKNQTITENQEREIRTKIARLRSQMFSLSEPDQARAGAEIVRLKALCAETWEARATQFRAACLEAMGY